MKAFGYTQATKTLTPESFQAIELPTPEAHGHDILVEVSAISVNPVDAKIRANVSSEQGYKVIGWDAVGTVKAVGDKVTLFNVGDRVYYAGDLTRQGSNAELQLVDERIVGRAPSTLSNPEAAALPLTSITAWELLFDRLQISKSQSAKPASLLVIGAAGGVGSILVQLAKQLTNLTVVATASRAQSVAWLNKLGVDEVLDHTQSLDEQRTQRNMDEFDYVISLTHTDQHLDEIINVIKPQGKLALIDDPASFDILKLKRKSISLHWEFMYTRSMYQTDDMIAQHQLLTELAELVDNGTIKTTLGQHLGKISVENLVKAHQILESYQSRGKLVLEGF
ncbi:MULTISPECIES: zinc-binding alcohol dehydrogenase family protein [unclassified Pseudoalteromonas]|uniref:zinc-binding alcohol dehydrogenase family protein n=1 Tax=unclassified Pseudoalteromonas TaxID=194690 RepID=UPI000C082E22|nr:MULTISPECIES: zinc-binding alcohol dehydrogenase family protein [unclassified Pseudoalteromonas]MDP2635212.1 zinc-binding alcohol dehydrogenase family protein [Pseudoalteromonas sp. 1_MG-2023]PHN91565.1 NADPH:quinone reductase [Pseudoalteromonas sp. 3D05]